MQPQRVLAGNIQPCEISASIAKTSKRVNISTASLHSHTKHHKTVAQGTRSRFCAADGRPTAARVCTSAESQEFPRLIQPVPSRAAQHRSCPRGQPAAHTGQRRSVPWGRRREKSQLHLGGALEPLPTTRHHPHRENTPCIKHLRLPIDPPLGPGEGRHQHRAMHLLKLSQPQVAQT